MWFPCNLPTCVIFHYWKSLLDYYCSLYLKCPKMKELNCHKFIAFYNLSLMKNFITLLSKKIVDPQALPSGSSATVSNNIMMHFIVNKRTDTKKLASINYVK